MAEGLAARLDAIAAAAVRPGGPHSIVLRVELPAAGLAHAAAAGVARAGSGRAATIDDRFHLASVGKMLTAALVLGAAGDGSFGPRGIDATLAELDLLPSRWLAALHPMAGTITLRHLLTHTSGMKDGVTDDATATAAELGRPAPSSLVADYVRSVLDEEHGVAGDGMARRPWRPWDPDALDDATAGTLNRFVASGTAAVPVGAPGERFHYSDTGYVLLGVLLEQATGRAYHELQRARLLEPVGARDTYLAYCDDPSPTARDEEMDVWLAGVPLLTRGYDLSFDWAGGGQVSTAADLLRLLRAVLGEPPAAGAPPEPLGQWLQPAGLTPPRRATGLGLFRWEAGHREVVGHAGAWGVRAFHDPGTGAWVAGTVNQQDECRWLAEVFDAVEEELA